MAKRHRLPGTASKRALLILPPIPDNLDPETKNALAIRNAASTNGVCPNCGAKAEIYRDTEHEMIFHAVFQHEPECNALTDGAAA